MKRVVCFLGVCGLAMADGPPDDPEAAYPALERFVEVMEAVRTRHPDVDRVTYERLVNHALEGMLASLDPHSSFIHPEMAGMMGGEEALDPEIASLGLTLGMRADGPYIAAVAAHGPAAEAGISAGAALLSIDGRAVTGVAFPELLAPLRRAGGESSKLELRPQTSPGAETFTLVHRVIPSRSIAESRMLSADAVGYVRLATFGAGCAREMEAALDELEDAGMKSLVLDLRGNGGGDLHETVKILGLFLPPETTVVTTRGRDEENTETLKTPERQRRKREYPVTVLIDRHSASASELTAGALQDLKRARIVGELSYGKGSVQNIIPMGGGTALRLTIATYHTPSGKTPHRSGITPDLAVETDDEDRANFEKRTRLESLPAEERAAVEAWVDPVLAAALKAQSAER